MMLAACAPRQRSRSRRQTGRPRPGTSGACGRGGREGRKAGDPPAGRSGGGCIQRRVIEVARPAQDETEHVGGLGRQLQPPRGGKVEPSLVLADHAGKPGVAQALLHGPQGVLPGLDEDDAARVEAGAGQGRRVKVASGQDPHHRARLAGQHPSGEQCRGGAVLDDGTACEHLVHRA